MGVRWGGCRVWGGWRWVPCVVGWVWLGQWTVTGGPVEAEQAFAWGLTTEIAEDPLAAAMTLAEEIAGKSPSAVKAAKALIGYAEEHMDDVDAVLLEESRAQARLIGKPHQMEVIAANIQKRKPVFK